MNELKSELKVTASLWEQMLCISCLCVAVNLRSPAVYTLL